MVHTKWTIQCTANGCRVRGTPILKVHLYVHFGHEAEEKRQLAWRKEWVQLGAVEGSKRKGSAQRTNSSENCFEEPHDAWHACSTSIAPNDSMTPGEMIDAAEHKVDSVSLRMHAE